MRARAAAGDIAWHNAQRHRHPLNPQGEKKWAEPRAAEQPRLGAEMQREPHGSARAPRGAGSNGAAGCAVPGAQLSAGRAWGGG